MKSILILVLLLLLSISSLYAQAIIISGAVKSEVGKEAIPFVNIGIKRKGVGTAADANGNFKLRLEDTFRQDTLTFSIVGYHTLSVAVNHLLSGKEKKVRFQRQSGANEFLFYLKPMKLMLSTVEVKAKHSKWTITQVGYNIGKGSPFMQAFAPVDTILQDVSGQEIGNNFHVRKYPVRLQNFCFGLLGSGNMAVAARVHIYSIKNKLPHERLNSKDIVVKVPPHYTGWIKVPLEQYNIQLNQDFAVVLEWINEANKLNKSSLMTFANIPKGQLTFYRESSAKPWVKLRTMSIGMYVTLLHE